MLDCPIKINAVFRMKLNRLFGAAYAKNPNLVLFIFLPFNDIRYPVFILFGVFGYSYKWSGMNYICYIQTNRTFHFFLEV